MTNGTENSVVLLTSTEKSGQPWLLLLLHYHKNTTLIWKTYFGTAPNNRVTFSPVVRHLFTRGCHLFTKAFLVAGSVAPVHHRGRPCVRFFPGVAGVFPRRRGVPTFSHNSKSQY